MIPKLSNDLILYIIDLADLTIDTKLKLGIKPKKLNMSLYKPAIEFLGVIHKRRTNLFKKNEQCLEQFYGKPIELTSNKRIDKCFEIFCIHDCLYIAITTYETIFYEELDNSASFLKRTIYCSWFCGFGLQ